MARKKEEGEIITEMEEALPLPLPRRKTVFLSVCAHCGENMPKGTWEKYSAKRIYEE